MAVKTPIRGVFDGSTATGLAEFQSGDFIALTHGGLGASLSIGSAGQVLKVNSGASALEFGSVETIVNIDGATNLESATLAVGDKLLVSDGGTEGRVLLSQLDTLFSGTTKTLTNKTISGSANTLSNIGNSSLSNSSVNFGGITVALGASDTTPAFDLSDATSYPTSSLTGTITNAQLAGSIANDKLANNKIVIQDQVAATQDIDLGSTFEIVGGSGVTTAASANKITITASGITNAALANDSVTIGSTEVNLGTTLSTTADLNLTGTSSLSGTGTIDLTGAGSKIRFDFSGYGSLPAAATYVGAYAYDSVGNRPYYSSGSGWVRILDENSSVSVHTDVNMSGVADGNVLTWSSSQGRFNVSAPAGGSVALDDVTDVSVSSPQKGHTLVYTGSNWEVAQTPVSQFVVTAPTSSAYLFEGAGFPSISGNNPTLYLKKGQTYYFRNTSSGHPFEIRVSSGGSAYNTGVTANNASGPSGVIIFHVPMDAPATLVYQCSSHSAMVGDINIT